MSTSKIPSSDKKGAKTHLETGISSVLIGMVLIGLSYSLMLAFSKTFQNFQQIVSLFLALLTTIIISISYIISRRGHTTLAGFIAACTGSLAILAVGAIYPIIDYWYLLYLIFPITLACLLLNRVQSIIFTVTTLTGAILVYFLNWNGDYIAFLTGPLVLLIAGGGFILTAIIYFQKYKLKLNSKAFNNISNTVSDDSIANHLLEITNRTNQIKDPDTLFHTLADEFQNLNYDFVIILIDPKTKYAYLKYNSINVPLLQKAQELSGTTFGIARKHISEYHELFQPVYQEGENLFFDDFQNVVLQFIPISVKLAKPSLNILGVSAETKGGFLPVQINDEIIGTFIIWGKNLKENDLPACRVFAGQIASMLEKANLGESEKQTNQNLIRTNAQLKALNLLSAKITSTTDINDGYAILGSELKKLGFRCMITLMEPDLKTGYFSYTSETEKISQIEKLLGIKIHGRRFSRADNEGPSLWIYKNNIPNFQSDLFTHLVNLFPRVPKPIRRRALSMLEINEGTPAFFLPLISHKVPIGSLTIWGESAREEDLGTFKLFADQIANMLEKANLLRLESDRSEELRHSYSLVNSLSDVSVKLTSTTNQEELFEILGREIKELGYNCMVSKLAEDGEASSFEFINTQEEILTKIEKLAGFKLIGYKFLSSRWPESLKSVYYDRKNVFIPNLSNHIAPLFPQVPKSVRNRALGFVGIDENSPAIYVPMISGEAVIGSIAFWGEKIQNNDLPAFSVFASQLANALHNAMLVDAEQEKSRELEHTNKLLNALSEVAIEITSVNDPDKIFPILGSKLKDNGYYCAAVLVDSDFMNAQINYTNADLSLIDIIENKLKIKVLGRNFTRENMTRKDIALYEQEIKVFFPNFIDHLYDLFAPLPKALLDQGAKMLGISQNTPAIYVPMVYHGKSIGSIMVWGDTLREDDLPSFSVLSTQAANALENTRLMDSNRSEIESRKKVQHELEISRHELQGIFNHAHDAIIIIDAKHGNIVNINKRACELYRIEEDEFLKRKIHSIIDEDYLADKLVNETYKNGYCNKLVTHYSVLDSRMTFEINSSLVEFEGNMAIQCINRDVTDQKKYEEQLKFAALHDSLTGLPNRALFSQHLNHAIARSVRFPEDLFAVIYMDLDNFKRINDSLGHSIGDQFIIQVAYRLQASIRASDTCSRFGGDEFVVLLENINSDDVVNQFCNRLKENLDKPVVIEGHEIVVSASIGIVYSSPVYKTAEDYLRNADLAMYESKKNGKNQTTIFRKGMHTGELNKLSIESQMRVGIKNNEFRLVYQPINSLQSGAPISYEALVRWDHYERGIVPPNEFIPIAEYSGLIHPLGKWILREACQEFQSWRENDLVSDNSTISVNISAIQLMHSGFVDLVRQILNDTKLPPDKLNLEVTETALITNPTDAKVKLSEVREYGVKIHLDDFGTGFSSLSFLTTFPIDAIKIDRRFIMALNEEKNFALIKSMQLLTKALGISLIAEGIETNDHLDKLLELECEIGQGYYFSKPRNSDALEFNTHNLEKEHQPAG